MTTPTKMPSLEPSEPSSPKPSSPKLFRQVQALILPQSDRPSRRRLAKVGLFATALAVVLLPWLLLSANSNTPSNGSATVSAPASQGKELESPERLSSPSSPSAASRDRESEIDRFSEKSEKSKKSGKSKKSEQLEQRDSAPRTPQPSAETATPAPSSSPIAPTSKCDIETMLASTQTSDNSSGLATSALVHQSGLSALANEIEPILVAHLSARPFPEINERARLAKVPVIMYHDILPEKKVFFDVTPQEFEQALQLIRQEGLTPISLDQLVEHLSTGMPLPEKPILLTFDDGYAGHYTYVYPLLKKYGYPGVFAIYTKKVGTHYGRSAMTWAQIREMAADPLVTIASHSLTHPPDLGKLDSNRIRDEVVESKRILEEQLGIPIKYFVYPEGKYNEQVKREVRLAGYQAALTMNDEKDLFAGDSDDLLSIDRIGQSGLKQAIEQAYGGPPSPSLSQDVTFDAPIRLNRLTVDKVPLMMASGGQPITLHANSRYQVKDIIAKTDAVAAVDGGFFSLEYLDSNVMVGPVYSQSTGKFVPGNVKEIRRISGRPLVLISPTTVKFVPFDPTRHNTLEGIQAELPDVTDAFVAAAWLVKDGDPQPARTFGNLFDFDAARDRAYWGINQAGQPVVGVSGDYVDSVTLGRVLSQVGMRDVVMLDSGASASLVYKGKSLMGYEPRPVPHVVALLPPRVASATCATTVSQARAED